MTEHVKDLLERYVVAGGTVLLARAHLYTGIDRQEECGNGQDLLPLFSWLPSVEPGTFAEKSFGKGKVVLFTERGYPVATAEGAAGYRQKIHELAQAVPQTAKIEGKPADLDNICYGAYANCVYLLNADTRQPHSFALVYQGKRLRLTLAPCEFRTIRP